MLHACRCVVGGDQPLPFCPFWEPCEMFEVKGKILGIESCSSSISSSRCTTGRLHWESLFRRFPGSGSEAIWLASRVLQTSKIVENRRVLVGTMALAWPRSTRNQRSLNLRLLDSWLRRFQQDGSNSGYVGMLRMFWTTVGSQWTNKHWEKTGINQQLLGISNCVQLGYLEFITKSPPEPTQFHVIFG